MRQTRASVLFTQLSGAIAGLKDKPNELLCVKVQMRDTILPPSFPAPSKGTVWVIRPLNYAQGQNPDLHLSCVCMCVLCVCAWLLKHGTKRQTERQVKGRQRKMLEACLWQVMGGENCVSMLKRLSFYPVYTKQQACSKMSSCLSNKCAHAHTHTRALSLCPLSVG